MTPWRRGRITEMLPGARPSMALASWPAARTTPSFKATIDGSLRTMPCPLTYTRVLAVPRPTATDVPVGWAGGRTRSGCRRAVSYHRRGWAGARPRRKCQHTYVLHYTNVEFSPGFALGTGPCLASGPRRTLGRHGVPPKAPREDRRPQAHAGQRSHGRLARHPESEGLGGLCGEWQRTGAACAC